jgi:hypothetical protein
MSARLFGRRGFLALVLGASLALAGCSSGGLGPDPEAEAVAKAAYSHLAAGELAPVRALLLPDVARTAAPETFELMRNLIPKTPLEGQERLNWRAFVGTGGSTQSFQHAYDYGNRRVIATTELLKVRGQWRLRAFNVNVQLTPAPAGR